MFDSLNSFKLIAKEWWNEKEGEIGHLSFSISSSSQRRHRRTRDFCNCTSAHIYIATTTIHTFIAIITWLLLWKKDSSPHCNRTFFLYFFFFQLLYFFFLFLTFLPYILATWKRIIFMISCVSFLSVIFFCEGEKERSSERVFIIFHKENDEERMRRRGF